MRTSQVCAVRVSDPDLAHTIPCQTTTGATCRDRHRDARGRGGRAHGRVHWPSAGPEPRVGAETGRARAGAADAATSATKSQTSAATQRPRRLAAAAQGCVCGLEAVGCMLDTAEDIWHNDPPLLLAVATRLHPRSIANTVRRAPCSPARPRHAVALPAAARPPGQCAWTRAVSVHVHPGRAEMAIYKNG